MTEAAISAAELARIYVATTQGEPDGWGQYCHPVYGASHWIMLRLIKMVGSPEATRLIKQALRGNHPDWICHWCGAGNDPARATCEHCNGG